MSIIQAVILGAVQGIAEFLPISSSGHLAIFKFFFQQEDIPILFDILLHVATLASVCAVFAKKIIRLLCVMGRFITRSCTSDDKHDLNLILALIIATFVTGILGILLKNYVHNIDVRIIPFFFIITGLLLIFSSRIKIKTKNENIGLLSAVIIGLAQGIGVLPGISRSGSTISLALLTGQKRESAGEFSFLLSIPAILAAFILELKSAGSLSANISPAALILGMLTAFAVGYASLKLLLKTIKNGKLELFAIYLLPLGIALSIYFWFF